MFKGELHLINYEHLPKVVLQGSRPISEVTGSLFKVNILKAINARREQKTTEMYSLRYLLVSRFLFKLI